MTYDNNTFDASFGYRQKPSQSQIASATEIVHRLLKYAFIYEFIIFVIPVIAGNVTIVFKDIRPKQKLALVSVKSLDKGLTLLHYECDEK